MHAVRSIQCRLRMSPTSRLFKYRDYGPLLHRPRLMYRTPGLLIIPAVANNVLDDVRHEDDVDTEHRKFIF